MDFGMYAGLDQDVDRYLDLFTLELSKDDVLILYTDGITEAMNAQEEEFGKDGILSAAVAVNHKDSEEIKKAIIDRCLEHIGDEKIHDDLSIMVIKRQ